ncbi:hypothetical protein PUMCH_002186 [Australozyma saopauloensis]|uniref:Rab-GAP TBC domain-containing protein n=1 Tax=Australozyma saopauloensis TaxID=291208 RepID=A0AAX4H8R4_9ASCO|nr:hypothetical protein PUMCH_002186 [[Candida] saopauloensis]
MQQDTKLKLLQVPAHQRTESDASHSYSVLDYYDSETILISEVGSDENLEPFVNLQPKSGEMFVPLLGTQNTSRVTNMDMRDSNESQMDTSMITNVSLGDASTITRNSRRSLPSLNSLIDPNIPPCIQPLTELRLKQNLDDKFDIYGFKKDSSLFTSTVESHNEWFSEYIPHLLTQKKKWLVLMKAHGLASRSDAPLPLRYPPKSEKVKKLVRRGIPPEWRGNAWFFYAGGYEKLNKNIGVYEKIVADTAGMQNKDTEVIERDLHRTFPDNKYFKPELVEGVAADSNKEAPMISALRRVLTAFAQFKPQIGYCQSLNFLVGLLLLFMSEERAFWMLVIITERIIPQVHSANLEGVHTDQGVLMICIHEYIPKLWSIIGKSFDGTVLKDDKILTRPPPLTLVTSAWFMSMFVGILPIESVLRIWDIIFYEGSKALFRLSLTICRLCMDHPNFAGSTRDSRNMEEQETDRIEIFQFIQNFPKSITDPSLLINLCFKKIGGYGFGFLSQDEINRCREFVAQQRSRLRTKKGSIAGQLSDSERASLQGSAKMDDEIHDVYGFQRSIMSGVAWNMHISSVMKKKLGKRPE